MLCCNLYTYITFTSTCIFHLLSSEPKIRTGGQKREEHAYILLKYVYSYQLITQLTIQVSLKYHTKPSFPLFSKSSRHTQHWEKGERRIKRERWDLSNQYPVYNTNFLFYYSEHRVPSVLSILTFFSPLVPSFLYHPPSYLHSPSFRSPLKESDR